MANKTMLIAFVNGDTEEWDRASIDMTPGWVTCFDIGVDGRAVGETAMYPAHVVYGVYRRDRAS